MLLYRLKEFLKEKTIKTLDILLKPVQYFFTVDKMNERYRKKSEKMGKDLSKCEKLVSKGLVKYLIKNKKHVISLHVGRLDTEEYGGNNFRYIDSRYFNTKQNIAKNQLNLTDKEVQKRIIEHIKSYKYIEVSTEKIDVHRWDNPEEYEYTYRLKYKG